MISENPIENEPSAADLELELLTNNDYQDTTDWASEEEISKEIASVLGEIDKCDFAENLKTDIRRRMQRAVGKLTKITEKQKEEAAKDANSKAKRAFNQALVVQMASDSVAEEGDGSADSHADSMMHHYAMQNKIDNMQKQIELMDQKARAATLQWTSDKSRYKELIDKKNVERDELAMRLAILERKVRFQEQKDRDSNMIRTNDEAHELRELRELVRTQEAELLDKKSALQANSLELSDTKLELSTAQSKIDVQSKKIDDLMINEMSLNDQIDVLKRDVTDRKQDIRNLKNELEDTTEAFEQQKNEYIQLRATALKKEEEFEDKLMVSRAKIDELQKHVRTLWDEKEEQSKTYQQQVEGLQREIAKMQQEREGEQRAHKLIIANLQHSAQTMNRLAFQVMENEKEIKDRVHVTEEKMQTLAKELQQVGEDVKQSLLSSQQIIHELEEKIQAQLAKEQERERLMQALQECNQALQKECEALQAERLGLQTELLTLQKRMAEIEEVQAQERQRWEEQMQLTQQELDRVSGELEALQTLSAEREREWEQAKQDFEHAIKQLEEAQQRAEEQLQSLVAEHAAEKQQLQNQWHELEEQYKADKQALEERERELMKERELLQGQVQELIVAKEQDQLLMEDQQAAVDLISEQLRQVQTQAEMQQEEFQQLQHKMAHMKLRPPSMPSRSSSRRLTRRESSMRNRSYESPRKSARDSHREADAGTGHESMSLPTAAEDPQEDETANTQDIVIDNVPKVLADPRDRTTVSNANDASEVFDANDTEEDIDDFEYEPDYELVDVGTQTDTVQLTVSIPPISDTSAPPSTKHLVSTSSTNTPMAAQHTPEPESFLVLPKKIVRKLKEVSAATQKKRDRKALLASTRIQNVDDDEVEAADVESEAEEEVEEQQPVTQEAPFKSVAMQTVDTKGDPFERLSVDKVEGIVRQALQTNNYYYSHEKGDFTTELPIDETFLQQLIVCFAQLSEDTISLIEDAEKDRDMVDAHVRDLLLKTARDLIAKIETSREESLSKARAEHAEQLAEQISQTAEKMREEQRAALFEQRQQFELEKEKHSEHMDSLLQKSAVKIKKMKDKFDEELQKARSRWEQELLDEAEHDEAKIAEPHAKDEKLAETKIDESSTNEKPITRKRRLAVLLSQSKTQPVTEEDRLREREAMRLEIEQEIREKVQREHDARVRAKELYLESHTKSDEQDRAGDVTKLMEQLPEKFQGKDVQVMRQELLSGELGSIGDVRRENFDRLRGKAMGSDELVNLTAIEHTLRYDTDMPDEEDQDDPQHADDHSEAKTAERERAREAQERQRRMQHKTLEIQKQMLKQRALAKADILDLFAYLHATERQLRLLSSLSAWQSLLYYQSGGLFLDVLSVHRDVLRDCVREKGGVSAALSALAQRDCATKTERWPESLRVRALELFRQDLLKERDALQQELKTTKEELTVQLSQHSSRDLNAQTASKGSNNLTSNLSPKPVKSHHRKAKGYGITHAHASRALPPQREEDGLEHDNDDDDPMHFEDSEENSVVSTGNKNDSGDEDDGHSTTSTASSMSSFQSVHQHFSRLHALRDKESQQLQRIVDNNNPKTSRVMVPLSTDMLVHIAEDIDFAADSSHANKQYRGASLADREWTAREASKTRVVGGLHTKLDNICFLALRGDVEMYDLLGTLFKGFTEWQDSHNTNANNLFQTCLGKSDELPFVDELLSALVRSSLHSNMSVEMRELFEKVCHVLDICDTYSEALSDPVMLSALALANGAQPLAQPSETVAEQVNQQEESETQSQGVLSATREDMSSPLRTASVDETIAAVEKAIRRLRHPLQSSFADRRGRSTFSMKSIHGASRSLSMMAALEHDAPLNKSDYSRVEKLSVTTFECSTQTEFANGALLSAFSSERDLGALSRADTMGSLALSTVSAPKRPRGDVSEWNLDPSPAHGLPKGFALAMFKDDEFEVCPGVLFASEGRVINCLRAQMEENKKKKQLELQKELEAEELKKQRGEIFASQTKKKRKGQSHPAGEEEPDIDSLIRRITLLPGNIRYCYGPAVESDDEFPPLLKLVPPTLQLPVIDGLKALMMPSVFPLRSGLNLISGYRYLGQSNDHLFSPLDLYKSKNDSQEILSLPKDLLLLQLMSDFLEDSSAASPDNLQGENGDPPSGDAPNSEQVSALPRGLYRAALSECIVKDKDLFTSRTDCITFENNPPPEKTPTSTVKSTTNNNPVEIPLGHELVQIRNCLLDLPAGVEVSPGVRMAATPSNMVLPEGVRLVQKARRTSLPSFMRSLGEASKESDLSIQGLLNDCVTILKRPTTVQLELGMEIVRRPMGQGFPEGMTPVPLCRYPPGLQLDDDEELVQLTPRFDFPVDTRLTAHWYLHPRPNKLHLRPGQYIVFPDPKLEDHVIPPLPSFACPLPMPDLPYGVILPSRAQLVVLLLEKLTSFPLPEGAILAPGITVLHPRLFFERGRDKLDDSERELRRPAALNALLVKRTAGAALPPLVERGSRDDLPRGALLAEGEDIVRLSVRFELPIGVKIDYGAELGPHVQLSPGTQLLSSTLTGTRKHAKALTVEEWPHGFRLPQGIELVSRPPSDIFLPFEYVQVQPSSPEMLNSLPPDCILIRLPRELHLQSALNISERVTAGVESVVSEYKRNLPEGTIFVSRVSRNEALPAGMTTVPTVALPSKLVKVLTALHNDCDLQTIEEREEDRSKQLKAAQGLERMSSTLSMASIGATDHLSNVGMNKSNAHMKSTASMMTAGTAASTASTMAATSNQSVNVEVVSLPSVFELPGGVELIEGVLTVERPIWMMPQNKTAIVRLSDRDRDLRRLAAKGIFETKFRMEQRIFPKSKLPMMTRNNNDISQEDRANASTSSLSELKKDEMLSTAVEFSALDDAYALLCSHFTLPVDCAFVSLPSVFEVFSWHKVIPGFQPVAWDVHQQSSLVLPPFHFLVQRAKNVELPLGFQLGICEEFKSMRLASLPPMVEIIHLIPFRSLPTGLNLINTSVLSRNVYNNLTGQSVVTATGTVTRKQFEPRWVAQLAPFEHVSRHAVCLPWPSHAQSITKALEEVEVSLFRDAHALVLVQSEQFLNSGGAFPDNIAKHPHSDQLIKLLFPQLTDTKAVETGSQRERLLSLLQVVKINNGFPGPRDRLKASTASSRGALIGREKENNTQIVFPRLQRVQRIQLLDPIAETNNFLSALHVFRMGKDPQRIERELKHLQFDIFDSALYRALAGADKITNENTRLRAQLRKAQNANTNMQQALDVIQSEYQDLKASVQDQEDLKAIINVLREKLALAENQIELAGLEQTHLVERLSRQQEVLNAQIADYQITADLASSAEKDVEELEEMRKAMRQELLTSIGAQFNRDLQRETSSLADIVCASVSRLSTALQSEVFRPALSSFTLPVVIAELERTFSDTLLSDRDTVDPEAYGYDCGTNTNPQNAVALRSRDDEDAASQISALTSLERDLLQSSRNSVTPTAASGANARSRKGSTKTSLSKPNSASGRHRDLTRDEQGRRITVNDHFPLDVQSLYKGPSSEQHDSDSEDSSPSSKFSLTRSLAVPPLQSLVPSGARDAVSSSLPVVPLPSNSDSPVLGRTVGDLLKRRKTERERARAARDAQTVHRPFVRLADDPDVSSQHHKGSAASVIQSIDEQSSHVSRSHAQDMHYNAIAQKLRFWSVQNAKPLEMELQRDCERVEKSVVMIGDVMSEALCKLIVHAPPATLSSPTNAKSDSGKRSPSRANASTSSNVWFQVREALQTCMDDVFTLCAHFVRRQKENYLKILTKLDSENAFFARELTASRAKVDLLQAFLQESKKKQSNNSSNSNSNSYHNNNQSPLALLPPSPEGNIAVEAMATAAAAAAVGQSSHDNPAMTTESLRELVLSLESKIERQFHEEMKSDEAAVKAQVENIVNLTELEKQLKFCSLTLKQVAAHEESTLPKDFVAATSAHKKETVGSSAHTLNNVSSLSEKEILAAKHHCQRLRTRASNCTQRAQLIQQEITQEIADLLERVERYQRMLQEVLPPKILTSMLHKSTQYHEQSLRGSMDSLGTASVISDASSVASSIVGFGRPQGGVQRFRPLPLPSPRAEGSQLLPRHVVDGRAANIVGPANSSNASVASKFEWFEDDASFLSQGSSLIFPQKTSVASLSMSQSTPSLPMTLSSLPNKVKFGGIGSIPAAAERSHLTKRFDPPSVKRAQQKL